MIIESVMSVAMMSAPCDIYEGQEWIQNPNWGQWDFVLPADGCEGPPPKLSQLVSPPNLESPCVVAGDIPPEVCACLQDAAREYAIELQHSFNRLQRLRNISWCDPQVQDELELYAQRVKNIAYLQNHWCGLCTEVQP